MEPTGRGVGPRQRESPFEAAPTRVGLPIPEEGECLDATATSGAARRGASAEG